MSCSLAGDDRGLIARVRAATQGRGADFVFEAVGHESAFGLAAELVRPGGELVFLGKVPDRQAGVVPLGVADGRKAHHALELMAVPGRARDFPWLVQSYLKKALDLDSLVTRRIRLDEVNSGFDDMRLGKGIRTVIMLP